MCVQQRDREVSCFVRDDRIFAQTASQDWDSVVPEADHFKDVWQKLDNF